MKIITSRACCGSHWFASGLFLLLVITCNASAVPPENLPSVIPSSYIVVFHDNVDTDKTANELASRYSDMSVGFRYRHALRGMAVRMPLPVLEKLRADSRVDYIEPDRMVSVNAQTLPTGIDRTDADRNPVANIDGIDERVDVDIAILDSGVDLDHPDLNIFKNVFCGLQGFRYRCNEDNTNTDDILNHGTHVAGIAAAIDNASGVVGMAPGARIWNIKVLDDEGNGSVSRVIAGVDYVAANSSSIEVANMSLTGGGSAPSLDAAISEAVSDGVVFTLAAGNTSVDVSTVFPAGSPDAITVSALEDFDGMPGGVSGSTQDDTFANFSNYGAGVDIMAPGVSIRSTVKGGGTGNKSGTSMASPHVAGAAALYLSQNPGASPATVKAALLAAGDPAPCATTDGICGAPQDPDGIQEPLLCNDIDGDAVCDYLDSCPTVDNNSLADSDSDGLTDFEECLHGTDATKADTDGDSLSDYDEVQVYGTDPLLGDTDGDGLNDGAEVLIHGTNPLQADSDSDGLTDTDEINTHGTDPLVSDTDADGLNDGDEVTVWSTDPLASNMADLAPLGARDGVVNAADYMILIRMITGGLTPNTADLVLGDINNNGLLDAGDAVLMSQIVLGLIPVP